MNRFKKTMLVGMTVLGLGSSAFAAQEVQAPNSTPQGAHAGMHKHDKGQHKAQYKGQYKEHMLKRQAELHDKLKLTPTQEAAWKTYTAPRSPADSGKRPDREEWAKLTAPERMEKMLERSKQRQEKMATRLVEMKAFYAQLTPEQQKIFNDSFAKAHRSGHHHGRSPMAK